MNHQPPSWADRFLEWFCKPSLLEDLQGDFYELFHQKCAEGKPNLAKFYYIWHVFRSLRPSVIRTRSQPWRSTNMTTNHLKIAKRVLIRNKLYSVLTIAGLTVGIGCFLMLGLFVKKELEYDQFHEGKDQIYRVWLQEDYGEGQTFFNTVTPIIFQSFLKDNFPQLEEVVHYSTPSYLVGENDRQYNETVAIISPEFFKVFDFTIHEQLAPDFLAKRENVILSTEYAIKFFGDSDALGKVIPIVINGETREFTVSAIYSIPEASSIQFHMAISSVNNEEIYGAEALNAWFRVSHETYVMVREDAKIAEVESGIQKVIMTYLKEQVNNGEYNIGFQPLTDIHLNKNIPVGIVPVGDKQQVYILGAIALLVLIMACLNFVTMSIGQLMKRFKEVGVRKVMGANRLSLLQQYFIESTLVVSIATLLGIGLTHMLLPTFNQLTGASVSHPFNFWHLIFYIGFILIIGFFSGIYPGLVLSGWKTTQVLKGNINIGRGHRFRRGIVVFQFMVAVFLISCTLIMSRQLEYVQTSDLGISYEATIVLPLAAIPDVNSYSGLITGTMERGQLIKEKLQQYPEISKIGMGSHVFGTPGWTTIGFRDNANQFKQAGLLVVDPYYFDTFQISIREGRAMMPENQADVRQGIWLNESAVNYFNLEDPVGKKLPNPDFKDHVILGIVGDFHYSSLHSKIGPLIILQDPSILMPGVSDMGMRDSPVPKIVFKFTGKSLYKVSEILEEIWPEIYPEEKLTFSFVEEDMKFQYAAERRMQRLVIMATILSIIVACLGLLGLTIVVVNSRTKEIGIRKISGASNATIFKLLAGNVTRQMLTGFVLSVPLAYWLMDRWLNDFAYRVSMNVVDFIVSGVVALLIAFLVIGYHTLSAARKNPVESLRSE